MDGRNNEVWRNRRTLLDALPAPHNDLREQSHVTLVYKTERECPRHLSTLGRSLLVPIIFYECL